MLLSALFSLSADLCLVDVRLEDEGVTLMLRSSQTTAACPACTQPSTHVHGHYTRRLADLPCQKRPVRVCLEVRRFACRTRGCPRTTFAERFPTLTRAYARRTVRQAEFLTEIAFAQGGKGGAQLAKRRVPGKLRIGFICWSTCARRSKRRWLATSSPCLSWTGTRGRRALRLPPRRSLQRLRRSLRRHSQQTVSLVPRQRQHLRTS